MSEISIINKYRPISFSEVLGNEVVIKQLSESLKTESRHHTYLFTGPSGVGKTTLARIIGRELNSYVDEIDAASNSGVEDTRNIVEFSNFKPVIDNPTFLKIIDECHSLSQQAWKPLLKLTEEPPPWLYICLCTTEPQKVPETIKTRAYPVTLRSLKPREIEELVTVVSEAENWTLTDEVFQSIVLAAGGSPRKALTILQAGHSVTTRDELSQVVADVESDSNPAIKLCQYLIKNGKNWRQVSIMLKEIEDFEEACAICSNYFTTVMQRSEEQQAMDVYRMLRSFTETTNYDKRIQFYSAVGKILWGQLPF